VLEEIRKKKETLEQQIEALREGIDGLKGLAESDREL
jgi:hypothetical protein